MPEKTIEELQAELQDSLSALEKERQVSEDLTSTVTELKESMAAVEEENEKLKTELADLQTAMENKTSQVAKTGNETFEYDGKKYEILCKSIRIHKLGKRTAMEIATDTDAQKALVESNSGVIREVV
jgi:chromosome segregation ATPase